MDYGSVLRSIDAITLIKEGGFLAALVIMLFAFIIVVTLLWNNIKHSQNVQKGMYDRIQSLETAIDENTEMERKILQDISKLHGVLIGMGLKRSEGDQHD